MGIEWPNVELGDLIEILTGYPFKSNQYSESGHGIKLLRGDNVIQGSLRWEGVKLWPEEALIDKHDIYWLKEGDVVLAMDRPWIEAGLKTAQITSHDLPALLVQRVSCLRSKNGLDQNFLRYLISSYWFTEYVKSIQTGTAVPHISANQIKAYTFRLPPEAAQIEIGALLKTLDDKIELNRQINATLESMAQALFKSWFVDFDPVIDNALVAGNPIPEPLQARAEKRAALLAAAAAADTRSASATDNAHPTQTAPHTQPGTMPPATLLQPLPADLRALFPDSFVFNEEMDWVPEGWGVENLGDVADVNWGDTKTTKSAYVEKGFRAFSAKGQDGYLPHFDFERTGVVVSAIGANSGFTWLATGKWSCIKNTLRFWSTVPDVPTEYLFYATYGNDKWPKRGSAQPFISQGDARKVKVLIPNGRSGALFGQYVSSFRSKMSANEEMSEGLATTRDLLLPRLLSGKVDLSELKSKAVEAI